MLKLEFFSVKPLTQTLIHHQGMKKRRTAYGEGIFPEYPSALRPVPFARPNRTTRQTPVRL
jgi:hypothetical protein